MFRNLQLWQHQMIFLLGYFTMLLGLEPTRGNYLNQPLPSDVPELFAPDILTSQTGYHSAVSFNQDNTIAVWSEMQKNHNMMVSYFKEGRWSKPENLHFGFDEGVGDGVFRANSSELYFLANRNEMSQITSREYFWTTSFSDRWESPKILPLEVRLYATHWNCSVSTSGNLYFTIETSANRFDQDLYVAARQGLGYQRPLELGEMINTSSLELTPCIAPDESFLLFARRSPDRGDMDLYISYQDESKSWSNPRCLGQPINSIKHDLCPILSPDGKVLFFLSQRSGKSLVYWVQTRSFLKDSY